MPFNIKPRPTSSEFGLCGTCGESMIIEGDRRTRVLCTWFHPPTEVRDIVRRCTAYNARNTPSEHDMKRIAWIIEIDKRDRSFVGFRPPTVRGADEID